MPIVDYIWDPQCPNAGLARANLLGAFAVLGAPAEWREWMTGSADLPVGARGYGSPTILVDGVDVAGQPPADDPACCRLYDPATSRGAPSVDQIVAAMRATIPPSPQRGTND